MATNLKMHLQSKLNYRHNENLCIDIQMVGSRMMDTYTDNDRCCVYTLLQNIF